MFGYTCPCELFWQVMVQPPRPPPAIRKRRSSARKDKDEPPRRQRSLADDAPEVGVGFASAALSAVQVVVDAAPLVHPDYSTASLQVLQHAVKHWGLEIHLRASADELKTALEVHKLFLEAIADCKNGMDNISNPIPGHYIVECGLDGDCFYHSLAFLCANRLPGMWAPTVSMEPLATAHKRLRNIVVDYLEAHGKTASMDPFWFNGLDRATVAGYTVERFINLFEDMDLAAYCAKQRKLHQFAGLPESFMWARMTGASLVVKTQDADPVIYNANGSAGSGWRAAAAAVQERAWVLFHEPQHYLVLWPEQRINHDMPLGPAAYGVKHWAHYRSRDNMSHKGKPLLFPKLPVFFAE